MHRLVARRLPPHHLLAAAALAALQGGAAAHVFLHDEIPAGLLADVEHLVNIDSGFGAACVAVKMLNRIAGGAI